MPISWNEIRQNAIVFGREWENASRENADRQTFWNEFFAVFGLPRKLVASFEEPVKKLSGMWGSIDLFWPGTLLVEHKSKGKSLEQAKAQALEYVRGLKDAGRDDEAPRYIITSDFSWIELFDLEEKRGQTIPVNQLHQHVDLFAFIPGYKQHKLEDQDPVNIKAVELLGDLHDVLEDGGYAGHRLERFLVRVLFCLFAEDTGLFVRNCFTQFVEHRTAADGSDLGAQLARMFDLLNTPREAWPKNLLSELAEMEYVNGDLFAENLGFAELNRDMRNRLLTCCRFDWSRISPAIFGSLFQSIMEPKERRQIGAHYTSERDILKLVRSLFLDDLRAEFESIRTNKKKLEAFHEKLGTLTFLDPACGCGNFLVVTYRELRLLEIDVLKAIHGSQKVTNIQFLSVVNVDAFYGIEIEEFPAQIAQVAMWLVDHQMNQALSLAFGQYFRRLPLTKSATIRNENALRIDWKDVLPPEKCSYVMGNPPFVGHQWRNENQQADMDLIWGKEGRFGRLDYVTAWYRKAADYISGTTTPCAFVSTNSICQGEQTGTLWGYLIRRGIKIHFAHRTFSWVSEARGKAHVHVVIVGFRAVDQKPKYLFDYEGSQNGSAMKVECENINPYLVSGPDVILESRTDPRPGMPQMKKGSQPTDGGFLILSDDEKIKLEEAEPLSKKWLRPFLGGEEFINGDGRWCLWLKDASPSELRKCPTVLRRVNNVKLARLKSPTKSVREYSEKPTLFTQDRQPISEYLAIPEVSTQRRKYIPIGYLDKSIIGSNKLQIISNANHFLFGILSSNMHMSWVKVTAGRLKSDFSYAPSVYNNFPWPEDPSEKQKAAVEAKAQAVLDARAKFPDSTLADLYDPLTMPHELSKAHAELDRAVDQCYRKAPFHSDRERVEFLFALYEKLTAPLTAGIKDPKPKARRKKGSS